MFKMALYQNNVILVQWYNWYKKVQLKNWDQIGTVNRDLKTCPSNFSSLNMTSHKNLV